MSTLGLLGKMAHSVFAAFLVFFVTLAVFPGITTDIIPMRQADSYDSASSKSNTDATLWEQLWLPLSFLNFNLFDFMGRAIASRFDGSRQHIFSDPRVFSGLALARLVFLPLFLLCNYKVDAHVDVHRAGAVPESESAPGPEGFGQQHHPAHGIPVIFDADVYPIAFMTFLGLTNGFVASLAMMQGPCSSKPTERTAAGTVMVTGLTAGLTLGSLSSFLLRHLPSAPSPLLS